MPLRRVFLCFFLTILCLSIKGQNTELLNGKSRVSIPFTIKQDFILIKVKLNGVLPTNFIFDTGAENTIIFEKLYADILGVKYDMRVPIVGSNLQIGDYALVTRDLGFKFDRLPIIDLDVLVLEKYNQRLKEYLGEEIHGIIGSSFFKKFIVEIDYKRQFITLHNSNAFNYRKVRHFTPLDVEIRKGKPYLISSISFQPTDSVRVNLLMDTGAGINLLLHSNTDEQLKMPDKTISGELGVGVSGVLRGYIGRTHNFAFGPHNYKSMITSFQDLDSILLKEHDYFRNGIIGNSLLSRFHLYFDYPSEQVYIKAERGYKDDFKYDRSGLTIIASGPELQDYFIQSVLPGSPADDAGLKAGDKILKLQCWPYSFYSLERINKIFKKKVGKKIRLKVKRGDKKLRFTFRLRKLI